MQMRFGVAAACVCYALLQLDNGNKRGFWIWQVIGLTFHLTAIVGIFIRLIYQIRLSRKQSVYVILFSFLCSFIPTQAIFQLVVTSLGLGRYQMYFINATPSSYLSLIFLIVLVLPFIYFEPQLRMKVKHYDLLLLLGLSSILVGCVTREVPILNRFFLLLSISYCAILPSYFHLFKRNASYLIVWSLLMAYAFLKFLPSMNYVQPYKNFLFE